VHLVGFIIRNARSHEGQIIFTLVLVSLGLWLDDLFYFVEITGCILGKDMCDIWWIRQHRDKFLLVYVGTIAIFQVVGSRSTTIADINELPAAELINRR
jgi:hypothetical protein